MKLNNDGSVEGQSFSPPTYTGGYPSPNNGETYRRYRNRVDELKKQGFHLGDLSWSDWDSYCKGSGSYQGVDADDFIY